jgi:hypothetical protein
LATPGLQSNSAEQRFLTGGLKGTARETLRPSINPYCRNESRHFLAYFARRFRMYVRRPSKAESLTILTG